MSPGEEEGGVQTAEGTGAAGLAEQTGLLCRLRTKPPAGGENMCEAFFSFLEARPALAQTVNESKPGRALPVSRPPLALLPQAPPLRPPQASWRPPSPQEDGSLKKNVSPAKARHGQKELEAFSPACPAPAAAVA